MKELNILEKNVKTIFIYIQKKKPITKYVEPLYNILKALDELQEERYPTEIRLLLRELINRIDDVKTAITLFLSAKSEEDRQAMLDMMKEDTWLVLLRAAKKIKDKKSEITAILTKFNYNLNLELIRINVPTENVAGIADTSFLADFRKKILPQGDNYEIIKNFPILIPTAAREEARNRANPFFGSRLMREFCDEEFDRPIDERAEALIAAWLRTKKGQEKANELGRERARMYFSTTADLQILIEAVDIVGRGTNVLVFSSDRDITETLLEYNRELLENIDQITISGKHLARM